MSERVTVQVVDRDGTEHAVLGVGDASESGLLAARFTDSLRDASDGGSGELRVPTDHPDAAALIPERIARFRVDGQTRAAIEIAHNDRERSTTGGHAGQVDTITGETVGVLFGTSEAGGSVVWPACGEVGGFTGDIRHFGWMDCCCFDHATRFAGSIHSYGRQNDPDSPFSRNEPQRWPDGTAERIWFEAPTEVQAGRNEIQSLTLGEEILDGVFTITFDGQTTADIGSPWSAAQVESAMEALSNVDSVAVTGSGIDSDPYLVEFDGASFANKTQPLMTVGHLQLNHPPPPLPQVGQTYDVQREQTAQAGVYRSDQAVAYFQREFTTTQDLDLVLFVSANEQADVYIDGSRIYRQRSSRDMGTESLRLPQGEHCITAKVTKATDEDNVGWLMATLATASQGQDGSWELGQVVVRTDDDWLVTDTGVGDPEPGITPGAILICLLEEGDDQGDLDGLSWDFTETEDSDGVPWSGEYVWGVKIGTGMLDVTHQVADLFDGTFHVDPDTLTLSVWQDRGTDRSATVVFTEPGEGDDAEYGGGILQHAAGRSRKRANRLLIETASGFSSAVDAGISGPDRRLGVTMGAAETIEGLGGFATSVFSQMGREAEDAALSTHGPAGLEPYTDFGLGDVITVPGFAGTGQPFRVTGIQMQMDGEGDPVWTVLLREVS
ncbi:MAG: hypothetical protein ACOC96_05640 [Actinomycetota bacterium]